MMLDVTVQIAAITEHVIGPKGNALDALLEAAKE